MSATQRLVKPKLPTILANRTHVDLPGYDVLLHYEHSVQAIPARLDVTKLEEALSRMLQLYPHCAGQLRYLDRRWFVELTNTGVLLEIEYRLNENSDSVLKGDWVVQDDLSPLLCSQPPPTDIINGSAPLVLWKLTFFDNDTCLGCSWYHSLGDGTVIYRCIHTLSQFYQGLAPEFPSPTFQKHYFPSPSHTLATEFLSRVPYLHPSRRVSAAVFMKALENKKFSHVRWRMDDQDLAELRSALSSNRRDGETLSKLDCFIAYIVAVLNRSRETSVRKVTNIVSCRDGTTSCDENAASNLVVDISTDVPSDMAGIATAFRAAVKEARKPDYIDSYLTLAGDLRLEAASGGNISPYFPDEDMLLVNLLTGLDGCSAHFGYPDGTRAHVSRVARLLAFCLRSNPVKDDEGVWRTRQAIEVSIGVPPEVESAMLDTLSRGVKHMVSERARL